MDGFIEKKKKKEQFGNKKARFFYLRVGAC
jgi:hypothetical protein